MTNTVTVYETKRVSLFCDDKLVGDTYVNDIDYDSILNARNEFYTHYNITDDTKNFLIIRMNEGQRIQMGWILKTPSVALTQICGIKIVIDNTIKEDFEGVIEYNNMFDSMVKEEKVVSKKKWYHFKTDSISVADNVSRALKKENIKVEDLWEENLNNTIRYSVEYMPNSKAEYDRALEIIDFYIPLDCVCY